PMARWYCCCSSSGHAYFGALLRQAYFGISTSALRSGSQFPAASSGIADGGDPVQSFRAGGECRRRSIAESRTEFLSTPHRAVDRASARGRDVRPGIPAGGILVLW